MINQDVLTEINGFLETWTEDANSMKRAFVRLMHHLESMQGVSFGFKGRAGVSYSLRAKHDNQKNRELFVLMDVIDDEPDARWLAVFFYGDLITDPDEKGDLVPEGLAGDDGYCFNLDEWDENEISYLEDRLGEACTHASR
ncbi:MAG: hypothetical protein WC799_09630 [Desulfobacteraceae bacterium]|jgi:hypothetical protein